VEPGRFGLDFRCGTSGLSAADFRVRLDFRVRREDAMDEDFETPDFSEFINACAKQFCPWCGRAMGLNPMGRPRVFCSI
jgi:hypothetical protein